MRYQYSGGSETINLATATYDELREAEDHISVFRGIIQSKLDDARALRQSGRQGAAPEDWARWNNIKRMQGGQLRKINRALCAMAQRRKQERREEDRQARLSFERCFLDYARQALEPHDFRMLLDGAEAVRDEREQPLDASGKM